MIYARSPALDDLGLVVLDEVHFLQDAYRGPVWEEVIIHLPAARPAGVPLGDGQQRRRAGGVDRDRPRPDRRRSSRRAARSASTTTTSSATGRTIGCTSSRRSSAAARTPTPLRLDASAVRRGRSATQRPARGSGRRVLVHAGAGRDGRAARPARPAAGDLLHLQPQPVRRGGAVVPRRRRAAHRPATSATAIREIVDARLGGLRRRRPRRARLRRSSLAQLEAGIAAHHAGMVPAFKEAVEACFVDGLIKVRVRHRDARRRHQHAGAHGRHREADEVHRRPSRVADRRASTPSSPGGPAGGGSTTSARPSCCGARSCRSSRSPRSPPAGRSTCARRSARRTTWPPTSSARYDSEQAHHLLNLSFAQYQADRDVVRLEARLERVRGEPGRRPDAQAESPYGDIWDVPPRRRGDPRPAATAATTVAVGLARLRPGEVVHVRQGPVPRTGRDRRQRPPQGRACASRPSTKRARAVARHRRRLRRTSASPSATIRLAATRSLPKDRSTAARSPDRSAGRSSLARRVRRRTRDVDRARTRSSSIPTCAQRMRAAGHAERLERELADLSSRVDGHNRSLAREFDRVHRRALDGLRRRRRLRADATADWGLTDARPMLARVFHECDLLITECLRRGCSTASTPRSSPACSRRSSTSTAAPSRRRRRGSRRPTVRDALAPHPGRSARISPPRSGRPASPTTARPIPASSPPPTPGSPARSFADVVADEEVDRRRLRPHDEAARSTSPASWRWSPPTPTTRARPRAVGELAFRGVVADVVVDRHGRRHRGCR